MEKVRVLKRLRNRKEIFYIVAFIAFLSIVVDITIDRIIVLQFRKDQKISTALELGTIRAKIEDRLNTNLSLLHGMAAYISVHPGFTADDFNAIAKALMKQSNSLNNIAAAPDFIIKNVYPLKENEKIIGLDYRKIPAQWEQALASKETRKMIIAGPLNLVQGGYGLVARVPVFINESDEFWGLVSSVLNFEDLMKKTEITEFEKRINIAIRGKDSRGDEGEIFWGAPELFSPDLDAVKMQISLPTGSWQMAATPRMGWATHAPEEWFIHIMMALITITGIYIGIQRSIGRQELIESEKMMRAMSEASHEAIIMIDSNDTITFWNPAAESTFGYTEEEMIGKKFHDIMITNEDIKKAKHGLKDFSSTGRGIVLNCTMEMKAVNKNGEIFPVERSVSAFQLQGKWYAVGSVRDISARKEYERKLNELATTDGLTSLLNRRSFMEKSEKMLKQAIRYKRDFSLIMFDLDHFKSINDRFGHDAGDEVLRCVASTLRKEMRDTDLCGRIGGEEFCVSMPEADINDALSGAERLRTVFMSKMVNVNSREIRFTVSIGVVSLNSHERPLSRIIKEADMALYEAKNSGRNRVVAGVIPEEKTAEES